MKLHGSKAIKSLNVLFATIRQEIQYFTARHHRCQRDAAQSMSQHVTAGTTCSFMVAGVIVRTHCFLHLSKANDDCVKSVLRSL